MNHLGRRRWCFGWYRYRSALGCDETDDDFLRKTADDLMDQAALQDIEKSQMKQNDKAERADSFDALPHAVVVNVATAHSWG